MSNLRISHYNILKGGAQKEKYILKVVSEINPDICGFLEVVGTKKRIQYIKKIISDAGYDYFFLAKANSKYNIAVFSKIPIKTRTIKKGIRHSIAQVEIKDGPFKNMNIFFLHLTPAGEDERLKETRILKKHLPKSDNFLIMGDFNSLSNRDPYDRVKLIRKFKKNKIVKYGAEKLRFDVIKTLEKNNLIDVSSFLKKKFTFTTPTPSNTDKSHAAKIRIDYAFTTKKLIKNIQNIQVSKGEMADKASDHYPLTVQLHK